MKNLNDHFLEGEKIYLRAYKEGDEIMVARIENHPDARETLFYAFPTSAEQQKEKIHFNIKDPNTVVFTICRKEDGEPIGQTAFFRIDWVGRMATFYIGIADKENWSRGYGSEATALMVEYAFQTLNLNRIQLHVAVGNKGAVNVYQKTGFKIEGTLREAMYHHGHYSDFYVMGILKKDREITR
ncbi:MAG: GNAT family N-acetyltransferase [Candidatus Marinimicrobia bacterium]|nr:GNAT family N-acetyltransferase [Candidatus Neomarinimicrobiota bacterium]